MSRKEVTVADALNVIGQALRGRVEHGATVRGTLDVGDLEVEVRLVATRKVRRPDADRYRREALELLSRESWRDRCFTQVKNRAAWSVTKTKSCEANVTTAIVYRQVDVIGGKLVERDGYRFCCSHHTEHNREVIAIVRLPQGELDAIRARHKKEADMRRWEDTKKEDRERMEKSLGRRIDDADMTVVSSVEKLSASQVAIVKSLLDKEYIEAKRFLRYVIDGTRDDVHNRYSPAVRALDAYLDSLKAAPK